MSQATYSIFSSKARRHRERNRFFYYRLIELDAYYLDVYLKIQLASEHSLVWVGTATRYTKEVQSYTIRKYFQSSGTYMIFIEYEFTFQFNRASEEDKRK